MGSGGSYYDRDVTIGAKTSSGFTTFAQNQMSRDYLSKDVLPLDRRLVSTCKSPLIYAFDITGSMDNLPVIIFDKMPMIAGQIVEQKYLDDPLVSLAAVGDVTCDQGPLQVSDFSEIKNLDPWLKKIWREGGGGAQHYESYEYMAYFYARLYDMQGAKTPILLFTGDEAFREAIPESGLRQHFGGQHEDANAFEIFRELKAKFKDNVFLLHRYYRGYGLDTEIVAMWEKALGKGYVIRLPEDGAVADLTLGIVALASGKRTLKQYLKDIRERPLEMAGVKYKPQSEERIDAVEKALTPLEEALGKKNKKSGDQQAPQKSVKPPKSSPKAGGLKI